MRTNVKKLTTSALLIALSILIPIVFGSTPLKIYIPPAFSATLGSHIPTFIGMFIGPFEATVIGIGSALGFLVGMGNPIIALRAASHIVVGYMGAKLLKKKVSFGKIVAITAPVHGMLEALVVLLLTKDAEWTLVWITLVGCMGHHVVDGVISWPIIKAIEKGANINLAFIGENQRRVV